MSRVEHYCGNCGSRIYPLFSTTVRCGDCGGSNQVAPTFLVGSVFVLFGYLLWQTSGWFSSWKPWLLTCFALSIAIPIGIVTLLRRIAPRVGAGAGATDSRDAAIAAAVAAHNARRMNEQKSEQRTETYRDALPGSAGLVLLFSEPPHAELDLGAVAAALSWALPDARTFFASPLPAVIATFTDEAKAAALARGLETLGVRTAVVAAAELANLPPAIAVTGFAIDEHGLAYAANGGVERRLAWSSVRLGFLVSERRFEVRQSDKDREDQSKGRAKRQQAASPWRSVGTQVDLLREAYDLEQGSKGSHTEMVDTRLELGGLGDDGTPLRLVLARDGLRYEGLGANRQKSAAQNWTVLLELIETRGAIEIDRSADRASPKPVMVGRRGLIDLARHESPAFQRIAAKPAQLHAAFLFWRSGVTAPRKVPAGEVERTPR